ncbi:lysophospholipid acyltransferase family protein [Lyngbya confervoides]|uniref:1-acyl-sn-glycerol-3-phosphate acyltransferase n=1 Tax=Lyngbya confervoides BDU141951 TaxID=1574623 RepID=A0ABD4T0V6_9CYAN|nr:lysophospholipid acyltransferase family protein [Lyngbya confervoides]MCM1982063.1 1-acyl-sn-glycerol-3-phosphate acyltransferase [Lyngbya confervoides BDU141951]
MFSDVPLLMSQGVLTCFGTQVNVRHCERIPGDYPVLLVSNHRSVLDAPLLMIALSRSVRFACHHYMTQVPGLRDLISTLGCLPLDSPGPRRQFFFEQAIAALSDGQPVGIFPEGAQPMVRTPQPRELTPFHRGFAHLALRVPVPKLAILPIAISALSETVNPLAPLKLFSWFDPTEPLFNQPGWHPAVHYHRVNVSIGQPLWITTRHRKQYQGRQAARLARTITRACYAEVNRLVQEGFV